MEVLQDAEATGPTVEPGRLRVTLMPQSLTWRFSHQLAQSWTKRQNLNTKSSMLE